jgi:hypothetical protein
LNFALINTITILYYYVFKSNATIKATIALNIWVAKVIVYISFSVLYKLLLIISLALKLVKNLSLLNLLA